MSVDTHREHVLIVGAGIIGIGCAHYLSKAGYRVTVIDRGVTAGACSHANCGYVCPSHVLPLTEPGAIGMAIKSLLNRNAPFRVKPRLSPALWNWMWQFARRCNRKQMLTAGRHLQAILDSSMQAYRELMAEVAFDCEWKEQGLLYVLQTARGMQEFAETNQLLSEQFGVAATRIEGAELPRFEPALRSGLAGAFHSPHDASVRPDLLNSAWSQHLRNTGVTFVEQCEVKQVVRQAGQIAQLETSQGPMPADRFVFATGAWSRQLAKSLGCRIPIEPGKGYSLTLDRPDNSPRYPMLLPEHKVGVSPFEHGLRLGSMMEFTGYDTSIPDRRIQQLRDSAAQYLAAPIPSEVQQTWYGWRPMTWDSLPILGQVPKLNNAYLATGHNMLGLSLATGTGRLIAEIIQGHVPHIDPTPYSPERF